MRPPPRHGWRDSGKSIGGTRRERPGQGGARKSIGQEARGELERILERRVHLFLFVKVREKWEEDPERYRALGLDFDV
jgi:hypothetical protein